MIAGNITGTVETDPGYGQLVAVLVRRRFWLLGVFCSVLAAAALMTVLKKPVYQSSMQLLVEPNYQGKKDDKTDNQFADANVEIDNSTQLTQMRSSQLLQRAVDRLKPEYPQLDVKGVQKSLVLTQVEEDKVKTKIFQAVYTDNDPVKTQKVLATIQTVYQDYNREQQKLRLTKGLAFVNEQLPLVEGQVKKAEDDLRQFRQAKNLVDPEVQSKSLVDALSSIRREQQINNAQIRDAQARFISLQQQLNRSPQQAAIAARLSQSTRYQTLLNEIQKTELALVQQRLRFKDRSAFVQQLLDQRQRQRVLLSSEVRRILGSKASQINVQGQSAITEGQLGANDLTFANELVEAQVNLNAFNARAQSLNQSQQSLEGELKRFPSLLAEYGRLEPRVTLNRETLQQLMKARQEIALEIARGGFDWQVVEKPKLGTQIGPDLKKNLLLGAVAGLMLGCLAAFVRDGVDDSVRTADDLEKQVALPLLGLVPELTRQGQTATMIMPFKPTELLSPPMLQVVHWQAFREALDLIYKNIQLLPNTVGLRSMVVTSALSGEGKSTLALGLAISAARLHQNVLLIDADLRRPSLHKQLDLPNDRGLSTLLAGETPLAADGEMQLFHQYNDIPISVLTSGPTPIDPAQLLSSKRMKELMAKFEQTFDLVILDAPPVLGIVDAILTGSFCDGVILVGRIGQVTRAELTQASAVLSKLNVIGVMANGSNPVTNRYLAYERRTPSAAL